MNFRALLQMHMPRALCMYIPGGLIQYEIMLINYTKCMNIFWNHINIWWILLPFYCLLAIISGGFYYGRLLFETYQTTRLNRDLVFFLIPVYFFGILMLFKIMLTLILFICHQFCSYYLKIKQNISTKASIIYLTRSQIQEIN